MKIWTPEECRDKYLHQSEAYGSLHNGVFFKESQYYLPERLISLTESYSHDIKYIEEALDLISWPELSYILEHLNIYVLGDPSYDQFNGSASAHWENEGDDGYYKGHITLFGKSTPIPRHMTHYIVVHEMGHVVQSTYCLKGDDIKKYRELRGATYEDRKVKWTKDWAQLWAEDFRWLFSEGSAHQDSWSMDYSPPGDEVRQWMLGLIDKHKG